MKNYLVIDDHEIVRSSVKTILQELFNPCHVDEAANEEMARAKLKEQKYNLVIMDIIMPDTDPIRLTEYIKTFFPSCPVLIFSMNPENIYAKRFFKAGAMGYISKNSELSDLKKAIELVLNQRKYISPHLAELLAGEMSNESAKNPFDKLSSREFEVANLLVSGKNLTEVSDLLCISVSTTGTHKSRLFEKLGVKNILELAEIKKAYAD